jgi:polyhydroxyalkanoate synthase subunit PhaC
MSLPTDFFGAAARVERWALDEVLLSGKLVDQILRWLYHEDRFCHGTLTVLDRTVGPTSIEIPMLAIVNVADEIAPFTSVIIDKMPVEDTRIIELPSEIGVCLPHLGTLVGRTAYARVWPQIVAWLKARG